MLILLRMKGIIFFFLIFLFCGCDNLNKDISKKGKSFNRINGPLLAKINNWEIGLDDFKDKLIRMNSYNKVSGFDINDFESRKDMLTQLITVEILHQIGIEKGMDKLKDVINLQESNKRIIVIDKVIDSLAKEVSNDEIAAFYEKNKDSIGMPLLEAKVNIRKLISKEKLNNEISKVVFNYKKRVDVEKNEYLLNDY